MSLRRNHVCHYVKVERVGDITSQPQWKEATATYALMSSETKLLEHRNYKGDSTAFILI